MISNETALIERARKEFHRHIARMATARDPNADMAAWAYAWGDMLLGNLARIARTPADVLDPAVSEAEVEAAVRAYLEHPADDVPGIGPVVNLHAAMRAALEAAQRARK